MINGAPMAARSRRQPHLVRAAELVAWDPSDTHGGSAVDGRAWSARQYQRFSRAPTVLRNPGALAQVPQPLRSSTVGVHVADPVIARAGPLEVVP